MLRVCILEIKFLSTLDVKVYKNWQSVKAKTWTNKKTTKL